MDAFRLSVPPDFVQTTLKGLDFTDLPSLQTRALELYTPLIVVFSLVVLLLLLHWHGKRCCLERDVFVEYRRPLLAFFVVTTVSTLLGLILFIYANNLTRQGVSSLVKEVPSGLFEQLEIFKNATSICPLQNVTGGTLASISYEVSLAEAYSDLIVDSFNLYVTFYDDLVITSLVFLFTFWLGMLVHITTGIFTLELEDTRTLYVVQWVEALFGLSVVSWTKEIFLLITIILTLVLLIAARTIGVVGVFACPTVETVADLLEELDILEPSAASNNSGSSLIPRNLYDYFVYCPTNASFSSVFGFDLDASSGFFDTIYNLGFECSANSSLLSCPNNTLPCGSLYQNASEYPSGFEFICPCSNLMMDLTNTLTDCTSTSTLINQAVEHYACGQLIPGVTIGYIALILTVSGLAFMLVAFTTLSIVLKKLNDFGDPV